MADFTIRFLICNLFVVLMIGVVLGARHLFRNSLTSRMRYNLWFPMLGLLTVPFIPIRSGTFPRFLSLLTALNRVSAAPVENTSKAAPSLTPSDTSYWMNDFGISVTRNTPSAVGLTLCLIWLTGILIMTVFLLKSASQLRLLKRSALPLQNPCVRRIYQSCLDEMHITGNISLLSTAFLSSPVMAGFFKPCIYLPLHLISDCSAKDLRYILLHELQHYRYKDTLINYMMNLIGVFYWFNPFIWYAMKEIRSDREVACDSSVLEMLGEDAWEDYGNTLINFAQKVSLKPFPFASGMGGSMEQLKKRIINISAYHPASFGRNLRSILAFLLTAVFLSGFVPVLSIQAADQNRYYFNADGRSITYIDLSAAFGENKGSFVLYDTAADAWQIYNMDYASARISPASTFKIYSALFALEAGVIAPDRSLIPWDGQEYRYELWNDDQTLESAMQNSVTWYFQALDRQLGFPAVKEYIRKTGYGNQAPSGDISSYWFDSSLKISPIEQVEMLKKLYDNQLEFSPENLETVKNSLCLYTADDGTLYGKTGTEEVNGQNTSGWFIGYIEKEDHVCFFAANIQNDRLASGPAAAELTFSVLSDLNLWEDSRRQAPK